MTATILAGGKNSRMQGKDKAFLKLGNEPLIKRQLRLLKRHFKKIIIVTNAPRKYINLKGIKIVTDLIPYQGPLGGIFSGLKASGDNYNFVFACDAPFLNLRLIKHMIHLKDRFDVVIPRLKKGYETLFAIYSKNCIAPIYETLKPCLSTTKRDDFRITNFFNKVKLKELNEEEVSKFGDPNILFMNINTKKDLLRAKKILR